MSMSGPEIRSNVSSVSVKVSDSIDGVNSSHPSPNTATLQIESKVPLSEKFNRIF